MPKRAVFERSRRELSLDVSVGVHILLVVEQSSLGRQPRGDVPRLRYYGTASGFGGRPLDKTAKRALFSNYPKVLPRVIVDYLLIKSAFE